MPQTKEQKAKKKAEYYLKNKSKLNQWKNDYRKTETGHKSQKINDWKNKLGMILQKNEEWESIYYFVEACENCEQCGKVFPTSKDKHLDHDHQTGFIRDVICTSCNQKRGYEDRRKLNYR